MNFLYFHVKRRNCILAALPGLAKSKNMEFHHQIFMKLCGNMTFSYQNHKIMRIPSFSSNRENINIPYGLIGVLAAET